MANQVIPRRLAGSWIGYPLIIRDSRKFYKLLSHIKIIQFFYENKKKKRRRNEKNFCPDI
jgi:hypothetical protein